MTNDIGKFIAVKRLNMIGHKDDIDNLIQEIDVMSNLDTHPNIVHYLGKLSFFHFEMLRINNY